MRTALRLALANPLVQFDPDTRDYIRRVEAADGAPLETQVRRAIDGFVRGCKADGIWNAIKASCIMAGARTLAGALVPLKGTAPTNFNFVSGDYDRKTGLKGDGSTKYLDSNRNNNADPQNSKHLSVYASTAATSGTGEFPAHIGGGSSNTGSSVIGSSPNNGNLELRVNGNTTATPASSALRTGFISVSRSASSAFAYRFDSLTVNTGTNTSQVPANININLYQEPVVPTAATRSNARLSFYSIGEALDLALLDARVTALMNELRWGLDGITDPDAISYLQAVETADGQTLETATRQAIQSFIVGCKADGNWDAIKASCIMAGARTLPGALVPLKGTAPTNYNFVSGDYDRKTGLKGDGSTKYLDSNRASNADPQNSTHASAYVVAVSTNTGIEFGYNFNAGDLLLGNGTGTRFTRCVDAEYSYLIPAAQSLGLIAVSRPSSSGYTARHGAINYQVTSASASKVALDSYVLAQNNYGGPASYSNARLSFYSIGEAVDLALLDARVTALMNEIRWGLDGITDPDAISYLQAVETADGQTLETATRQAIQSFIVGCKADGIWDAVKASCIMAGARTLAGALVPLKGTAPTNFNFVSGDYDRKTGLKGDGSTKYLDSNRNNNADPQDNRHLSTYTTQIPSVDGGYLGSGNLAGESHLYRGYSYNITRLAGNSVVQTEQGTAESFYGALRTGAATVSHRVLGVTTSASSASVTPVVKALDVFRAAGYTNARLSFYSIGEALDLALLDARVSTLMSAFTSVIP